MARVFLAGASGAVGRLLAPMLVAEGWRVFGATRAAAKAGTLEALGCVPVVVDVFEAPALAAAVSAARPELVIHQLTDLPYGLDPALMEEGRRRNARIREEGTRNLLAAAIAAGARRLIAQSIAFAYAPGTPPYAEDAPLDPAAGGVISLESQVLAAPIEGIVLRYGRFYGPGTGVDTPAGPAPLHVAAAARAAALAARLGVPGIYNIAEEDGFLSCAKARAELGWTSSPS